MSERLIKVDLLPPHLKTEDGAKRFDAAVEQRNQADYRCFLVLRDLEDAGALTKSTLAQALTSSKFEKLDGDDREYVEEFAEQVQAALENRRDADTAFSNALLGRDA